MKTSGYPEVFLFNNLSKKQIYKIADFSEDNGF